MASLSKEIVSPATPDAVWDAIRDIGALHTRLVPGFVTATELIPGGRRVTFGNGMVVDEPIIDSDDDKRRLAWTATGEALPHERGSRVVWTADLLPNDAAPNVSAMMDQGMAAMERALDRLAKG
jgi:hypothetical protein